MGGINLGRVILGGIVAGVIANVGDYAINQLILPDDMAALTQRLGLDQGRVEASIPTWIVVDFLYGILLVFAYAAMRPRFGPGPRTAVIAGVTLYLAITVVLVGFMSMGMFAEDAFLRSAGLSLIVTLAASIGGAAAYKE